MLLWTIPLVTALIGWITNVIAVKMLFHPRRPIWGFQGLIPRRQEALATSMADIFEKELLSDEELLSHILKGDLATTAGPVLDRRLDSFVEGMKAKIPMAGMFGSLIETARGDLRAEILKSLPELQEQLLSREINLRGLVEEKIRAFSIPKLEQIVLHVATRELRAIELLGGLLGLLIGLVQVALMLLL